MNETKSVLPPTRASGTALTSSHPSDASRFRSRKADSGMKRWRAFFRNSSLTRIPVPVERSIYNLKRKLHRKTSSGILKYE
jgi:hypothetical protein